MTITLISASFLGLLFIYLSYNVAKNRGRAKVSIGDGGDSLLATSIRVHANFAEYVPLGLILIALLEYRQVNSLFVTVLAAAFVLGRYLHGLGFGKVISATGNDPFRAAGILLTWLTILVGSVAGLLNAYSLL